MDSDDLFSSDGEEEWLLDDIVPPSSEDEDYIVPNKKRNTGRLPSKAIGRASRKFVVKDMSEHEFKSISAMDEIIVPFSNVKKGDEGAPITWRQIKWIRINKDDPFTMNIKYTLGEECEFRKVSLKNRFDEAGSSCPMVRGDKSKNADPLPELHLPLV
ncbi:hypothetical protein J6590_012304 [Homalodisca vitripennis]|nr:hypothetical protein J6590_012304 [Homalodisca vitripennis]